MKKNAWRDKIMKRRPVTSVVLALVSIALTIAACQPRMDVPDASSATATATSKPVPELGGDQPPPGTVPGACVAAGGICSYGGRCHDAAKSLYPVGQREDLDHSCGKGSVGATCCVPCEVPPDAPGQCCVSTYTTIPVCINGKLGCPPGARGTPGGAACN